MHHAIYHMTFFQAIVIGLLQGVTELFPISSLGHTVLVPAWIGGTWGTLVRQESEPESPYLAFVVGLHLATAVVLLCFYFREWVRLVVAFFRLVGRGRAVDDQERLALFIVVATIPAGILGIVLEHQFRVLFAKPLAAAIFLMANGAILVVGEAHRRRREAAGRAVVASAGDGALEGEEDPSRSAGERSPTTRTRRETVRERIVPMDAAAEGELAKIGVVSAFVIGLSQALALLAGFSREGVSMVGGLYRGLDRENAMRFSFLLATPVIFAAGALKIPDLLGPLGDGVRAQVIAGSVAAVASSLFAVVFLARYFKTRTLLPFAVYCLAFGLASVIRFGVF